LLRGEVPAARAPVVKEYLKIEEVNGTQEFGRQITLVNNMISIEISLLPARYWRLGGYNPHSTVLGLQPKSGASETYIP